MGEERGRPVVPIDGTVNVTIIINGQEVATDRLPTVVWNVIDGCLEVEASFELFQMERK